MVSLAPDTSNGFNVSSDITQNPFSNTTPINFGGLYSGANTFVNQTAQTPGAAQQANSNIGNIINGVSLANKGFNWLTGTSSTASTANAAVDSLGVTNGVANAATDSMGVAGGYAPEGFQSAASTFGNSANAASTVGNFFSNNAGILGGQAFGTNGFLGSLGSDTLNSVGSGIANAGAGFLGNYLGSKVFGNSAAGSIGGTIGGIAGSYFGPLGSAAGSFIGEGIGSLFGGSKTPHPAGQLSGIQIGDNGALSGGDYSGKHLTADSFKTPTAQFQNYLQAQTQNYGVTIPKGSSIQVGYDVGGQFPGGSATNSSFIGVYNPATKSNSYYAYNASDAASQQAAYKNAFNNILTVGGVDPTTLQAKSNAAQNVKINVNQQNQPSDWDNFITQYRASHPGSTPTT